MAPEKGSFGCLFRLAGAPRRGVRIARMPRLPGQTLKIVE